MLLLVLLYYKLLIDNQILKKIKHTKTPRYIARSIESNCAIIIMTCFIFPFGRRLVFSVTLNNLIFSFCVFPCILVSSIKQQWIFGSIWCYINAFFTILVKLQVFLIIIEFLLPLSKKNIMTQLLTMTL